MIWTNGELDFNKVLESTCSVVRLLCYVHPISSLSLFPTLPPSPALFCSVLDGWRRQELALKEEDEEFSDELREDCDLRGEERGGERMRGEGGGGDPSQ